MVSEGIPLRLVGENNRSDPTIQQKVPIRSVPNKWFGEWGREPQTLGVDTRICIMIFAMSAYTCACIFGIVGLAYGAYLTGAFHLLIAVGVVIVVLGAFAEQKAVVLIGVVVVCAGMGAMCVVDIVVIALVAADARSSDAFKLLEGKTKQSDGVTIAVRCVDMCLLACVFCPIVVVASRYSQQL